MDFVESELGENPKKKIHVKKKGFENQAMNYGVFIINESIRLVFFSDFSLYLITYRINEVISNYCSAIKVISLF